MQAFAVTVSDNNLQYVHHKSSSNLDVYIVVVSICEIKYSFGVFRPDLHKLLYRQ